MAICGSTFRLGWLAAFLGAPFLLLLVMSVTAPVSAQEATGTDPRNRHCQTLLTCNYTRGGVYRGCLSSYTCRTCRPQPVRCSASDIASGRTRCTELVCSWGG